jgi:hypothetical protein
VPISRVTVWLALDILTAAALNGEFNQVMNNCVSLTGSESLSNKTLVAPVLSGTVTGTYTLGGTPTFSGTPAFGSLSFFNVRRYFYLFDDLHWNGVLATSTPATQIGPFMLTAGGSADAGSAVRHLSVDNTHPGVIQLETGTTTTGFTSIWVGSNSYHSVTFGGGSWTEEFLVRIPTLSAAGERFTTRIGFFINGNAGGSGDATEGVYLRQVDNVNSGNIQLIARDSSSETATNTSTNFTANTWQRVTIAVNAAGTSAEFFLNGSSIGTVGTTIPVTAGRGTGIFAATITKSTGTTERTVQLDYLQVEYIPTAART